MSTVTTNECRQYQSHPVPDQYNKRDYGLPASSHRTIGCPVRANRFWSGHEELGQGREVTKALNRGVQKAGITEVVESRAWTPRT